MKKIMTVMFLAALAAGCRHQAPPPVADSPIMPFRFIGSLHSVSSNSYMNVHGEEWGMGITIEQMLEGEYKNTNILWVGISDPTNPPLQSGRKYEIRAAWGRHGMEILDLKPMK